VKIGSVFLFLGLLGLSVPTEQKMSPDNSAVAPPIGLEVGQPAPSFVLSDQFGHQRSNETLKGSKGTILLFFRSADW
jgi:cytochrome oxidase Cu insertion factor (SCO1/SenC/PrrC family)